MSPGRKIITRLRGFLRKLRKGEPFEVTRLRRVETPDGPMHLRATGTVRSRREAP